jgi:mono/diheme cytochrome c family protein
MTRKIIESIAVVGTIVGIAITLFLPFVYEDALVSYTHPNAQVITLTGVASAGTWTKDEVRGGNYWSGDPEPARPVLQVGQKTLLRLKSADVTHTFYAPALGIGPVEVYPGHVVEIEVTPTEVGEFEYYCTTVCGEPHFNMRGTIVVNKEGSSLSPLSSASVERYWLEPSPPPDARLVEKGRWLFRQKGCVTCHGSKAEGGITNWNYVNDTVPDLNTLAERLMLFDPEDADAIVGAMEEGTALEQLRDSPPVPRFNVFLAQYQSVREVMRNGNPPGKKDPDGPSPPLEMLAWGQRLSESDIDALIAYLLTLQPWEEEDY